MNITNNLINDNSFLKEYFFKYIKLTKKFIIKEECFKELFNYSSKKKYILKNYKLKESFIIENIDNLTHNELNLLLIYQKLNSNTLEEYIIKKNKEDWILISKYQDLDDDFMNKYKEKLHWDLILKYKKLKLSTILKFKDYIDFELIINFQKITEKDLSLEFIDKINIHKLILSKNLSYNFIKNNESLICWDCLSRSRFKSNNDIYNYYYDKLNWFLISLNKILDESIIDKFNNKINWNLLLINQCLSEDLLIKYKDKLNWSLVSEYQNLSENFIINNKNLIDYKLLLNNKYIKINKIDLFNIYSVDEIDSNYLITNIKYISDENLNNIEHIIYKFNININYFLLNKHICNMLLKGLINSFNLKFKNFEFLKSFLYKNHKRLNINIELLNNLII